VEVTLNLIRSNTFPHEVKCMVRLSFFHFTYCTLLHSHGIAPYCTGQQLLRVSAGGGETLKW